MSGSHSPCAARAFDACSEAGERGLPRRAGGGIVTGQAAMSRCTPPWPALAFDACSEAGERGLPRRAGEGIVTDQPPWNPWQKQGQPQYPPQQPYGQQPYPQGPPPYGQQIPGQYPAQSPYQGQQYAPVGTQPPYPGPGYGYGPQPPQRRKRHRVRNVILGAGGLLVAIIVVAAIASPGSPAHTVTTGQAASSPSVSASKTAKPGAAAKVGSTVTLAGNGSGER